MTASAHWPRALLALLVLVTAMLAAIPGTSIAAPPRAPTGALGIEVASIVPAVLTPADTLTVTATIHNGTESPVGDARAVLAASSSAIRTRSAIDTWVNRSVDETIGRTIQTQDLGTLEPGASVKVTFTVASGDLNLDTGSEWGARALAVALESTGTRLAALRTFLAWDPGTEITTPLGVTILAAITGPPVNAQDAAASAAALAEQTSATGRLGRLVEATAGYLQVGWVIDPALIWAAQADAASAGWANRLLTATANRDVAALPAYDLDLASFAHHPQVALPAEPTAPKDAADDPTATWRRDIAWPADATPDLATVALGASRGAMTTVVGAGMAIPKDTTYTPSGVASIATPTGAVTALVADPVLSDLLTESGATATQRLLAETAIIARERPNQARELLAVLDRGWDPDVASFQATMAALDHAPWVRFSTVDALRQTPVPEIAREPLPDSTPSPEEITARNLDRLHSARGQATAFAVIAEEPEAITGPLEPGLVVPASIAYRTHQDARQRAIDAGVAAVDEVTEGSIQIVPRGTVRITARDVTFPVLIRNDLAQLVTVEVVLVAQGTGLEQSEARVIQIPARGEVSEPVPVDVIASGNIVVEVHARAPGGGPDVATPIETRVVLIPQLDTVGTWVFVVGVALLLVGGIWRTVRRGRSLRRRRTRGAVV